MFVNIGLVMSNLVFNLKVLCNFYYHFIYCTEDDALPLKRLVNKDEYKSAVFSHYFCY